MDKHLKESSLLRKSLLSIRSTPFTTPPLFRIHNWNVYDAGSVQLLPAEDRARNKNYQIEKSENEKILVRMFLSSDKSTVERTKYFYLLKNSDEECTLYIVLALLARVQYKISPDHELLPFGF
jgi:hypothetical protein